MATSGSFSIDDAFRLDEADIQSSIYGSTTENIALTSRRPSAEFDRKQHNANDNVLTHQQDDRCLQTSNANCFTSTANEESGLYNKFQYKYWWRHPHVERNWKTVLTALLLVVAGIALLTTGIAIEVSHDTGVHSFIFFIAAVVCLLPGVYHGVYVYCAVKGHQGYSFYHLPVFR